ncbi:unnamed protein product [Gongylonema pulchrum]|uniref:G-patch domain-containing protein n=1 Tax=Gongylonema pulchrum TaxID=637853 RepID=A0A183DT84_9BILA|nr:unnamed protein product [Gongylonema pulchrum]
MASPNPGSSHDLSSESMVLSPQNSVDQKGDVKFTFPTKKRNTLILTTNVLGTEKDESDATVVEVKRQRLTHWENGELTRPDEERKSAFSDLVIPATLQMDWRTQRLLQRKDAIEAYESVSSVDADYDAVPIDAFGLAVLRGCGWREGEGIGKTNKRIVPLRVSSRRPQGLGVGAERVVQQQSAQNDAKVKEKKLKKSSLVKVTGGIYRGFYGRVESVDEDNASVIVQLALNGRNVRVSQFAVEIVAAKEFDKKSSRTNGNLYPVCRALHMHSILFSIFPYRE